MQIKPNKTIVSGRAGRVLAAPDGYGAIVQFKVSDSSPARGYADFMKLKKGSTVELFTATPGTIHEGSAYVLTTSVLGGPRGERNVIESVTTR